MSLTTDDLRAIREVVKNEVTVAVRTTLKEELSPINDEIEALRNDIKDIYGMLAELQENSSTNDKSFEKLSVEKKLLRLHAELIEAARQAGVTLPSH